MEQDAVPSLDVISANHTINVEECCSRKFIKWHQRTPKASWKQLIEALKQVKLTQLASELEELLIPSMEKCAVKKSEAVSLNNQQECIGGSEYGRYI